MISIEYGISGGFREFEGGKSPPMKMVLPIFTIYVF